MASSWLASVAKTLALPGTARIATQRAAVAIAGTNASADVYGQLAVSQSVDEDEDANNSNSNSSNDDNNIINKEIETNDNPTRKQHPASLSFVNARPRDIANDESNNSISTLIQVSQRMMGRQKEKETYAPIASPANVLFRAQQKHMYYQRTLPTVNHSSTGGPMPTNTNGTIPLDVGHTISSRVITSAAVQYSIPPEHLDAMYRAQ